MSFDFALETKLRNEAPELHRIFKDNVLCCQNILVKYKAFFPNYTDHTVLHSLEVIAFCNELIGDNIERLNCDEIFVLLMAAYLHDSGMGITLKDYETFSGRMPQVQAFVVEHPDAPTDEIIRRFHNDFSGEFIKKYALLFDFPSEEHLFAVVQTSRGHRKTNLYDEKEYPRELQLPNGNIVHLPYLATLIRLADELDIAVDRNIQFLFDMNTMPNTPSRIEFQKHQAIRQLEILPDIMRATVDYSNPVLAPELDQLFVKLNSTLSYCVDVVEKCTPFSIAQKTVEVKKLCK